MEGNELSAALRGGKRIYGTAILSPSPRWIQGLAGLGLDCVFIDTEHIPLDIHQVAWMCHGYRGLGYPSLVRIPSPSPYEATRVLDAGATGIIAPYIESVEQVVALRGAIKLQPLKGKKLQAILAGDEQLDGELGSYIQHRNRDHVFVINIESVPAMQALDDILKVPGLDAVLIGPHDLSCNLGIPEQYDHPRFDQAVREIFHKARAHNVGAGIHYWVSIDQVTSWMKNDGLNLLFHHSDLSLFRESLSKDLRRVWDGVGEERKLGGGEDKAI